MLSRLRHPQQDFMILFWDYRTEDKLTFDLRAIMLSEGVQSINGIKATDFTKEQLNDPYALF